MALVVKDTDVPGTVTVSVSYTDAKGKPATVDGAPTWVASDPTIIDSVTPAADGLSAVLHITDSYALWAAFWYALGGITAFCAIVAWGWFV